MSPRGGRPPSGSPGRPPSSKGSPGHHIGRPPSHGRPPAVSPSPPPQVAVDSTKLLAHFRATGLLPVGTKLPVVKRGETANQPAEIVAIKTKPEDGQLIYYVHYVDFNKRLDEWVTVDRLDVSNISRISFPVPGAEKKEDKRKKTDDAAKKPSKLSMVFSKEDASATSSPASTTSPSNAFGKDLERTDSSFSFEDAGKAPSAIMAPNGSIIGTDNSDDEAIDEDKPKEKEEEKDVDLTALTLEEDLLRLSQGGSMTSRPEEISRVKNINKIEIGKYQVEAWYFSPYPPEFEGIDLLFICEFCLKYMGSKHQLERHRVKCPLHHPPGNEIYRKGSLSFFELDGHRQKTYCRNLCLLSKLFLDHKTLYYDVDPFMFYVMTETDAKGSHIVGYFSKEKDSAQGYNLACILTLPQHQRKGYGKLLIAFSYELSKLENKPGSPEKPLSDLGLLSYRSYWFDTIMTLLKDAVGEELSIDDVSKFTGITLEDTLHTLTAMSMLKYYKGNYIFCITEKHREDFQKSMDKQKARIDPTCLNWKPPVFSSSQLRYV